MTHELAPARRQRLAALMSDALEYCVPGSAVSPRGSLAGGTADEYSDVDLSWVVPDERFPDAVEAVPAALESVGPVMLVRTDPHLARSERRRLVFAHLRGLPAFWRVDLDIRARSVAGDDGYDWDNAAAYDARGWSRPASALANAVAAVKALHRGRVDDAVGLVTRGLERIGRDPGPASDPVAALPGLIDACLADDAGLAEFASTVSRLVGELPPPG